MYNQFSRYGLALVRMSRKQFLARARRVLRQHLGYMSNWHSRRVDCLEAGCSFGESFVSIDEYRKATEIGMSAEQQSCVVLVGDMILQNRFRFLNQSHDFGAEGKINWCLDPFQDKLWQYNLHYQDYLLDLIKAYAITNNDSYLNRATVLIDSWAAENKLGTKDAWEPYTIAKRLVNWAFVVPILVEMNCLSADVKHRIFASVALQSDFLLRNIEYDVDNNHLIADAKALAVVGTIFTSLPMSKKLREIGFAILWGELGRQVAPEGSNYENSISYHMVVLQDYFETLLIAENNGISVPSGVWTKLQAMFGFLANMVLPTGEVFLVNDSVDNYPMDARELLAVGTYLFKRKDWKFICSDANLDYLGWTCGEAGVIGFRAIERETPKARSIAWEQSGYYIMRTGWSARDTVVLFDGGPLGPKHSCGHSHADSLSICLYAIGGLRLVDSGVYEYRNSPWRSYFRSTQAHNTVTIDGENQSDVWHSFRVGRMANCTVTTWSSADDLDVVEGYHDGYCKLRERVVHRRRVEFHKPSELRVYDLVTGRTKHLIEAFFHFVPSKARVLDQNRLSVEFADGVLLELLFEGSDDFRTKITDSWISREWKRKFLSPCIRVSALTQLPFELETTIRIIGRGDGA